MSDSDYSPPPQLLLTAPGTQTIELASGTSFIVEDHSAAPILTVTDGGAGADTAAFNGPLTVSAGVAQAALLSKTLLQADSTPDIVIATDSNGGVRFSSVPGVTAEGSYLFLHSTNAYLGLNTSGIATNKPFVFYNGINTSGTGARIIYGATLQKSETGADANVLTYVPPATAGFYSVSVNIDCSIWAANMSATLTYKDSNGTAVSKALIFSDLTTGLPVTVIAATGNYGSTFPFDIDNSATNIVIAVTGAIGNTYKISAAVEQMA